MPSHPKLHLPRVPLRHHHSVSGVHQALLEPPERLPIGVESRLEHGLVLPIVEIWLHIVETAGVLCVLSGARGKFRGVGLDTQGGFLELQDFVLQVVRAVLIGVGVLRVNLMGWGRFIEILVEVLDIVRAIAQLLHF